MKARPVIQAGIERPDRKKSVLVLREVLQDEPDPEHEAEVDEDDQVVDPRKLHAASGTGDWALGRPDGPGADRRASY